TYDHRTLNTGLPVRSALLKQRTGGLVVRWVTTGESPLLYVFAHVNFCFSGAEQESSEECRLSTLWSVRGVHLLFGREFGRLVVHETAARSC
ncbi:hypothetical protein GQ44DRAFT_686353, partial [Phaeosphaeriaceae sp. PMI808]